MIDLRLNDENCLELEEYSPDCTLAELVDGIAAAGDHHSLCARCARCCRDPIPLIGFEVGKIKESEAPVIAFDSLTFPAPPDAGLREKSVRDLERNFGLSRRQAEVFYEYNSAEPIALGKADDGRCFYQQGDLCGIYAGRPLVCRLYHCRQGARLSGLRELIMARGIWHSFVVMGWLDRAALADNPFAGGGMSDDILLKDFDLSIDEIVEKTCTLY